jgi:hypothetical protein
MAASLATTSRRPARRHSLVTLLARYSLRETARVLYFIDDQGFCFDIYFVDETDHEFSIVVPKDF